MKANKSWKNIISVETTFRVKCADECWNVKDLLLLLMFFQFLRLTQTSNCFKQIILFNLRRRHSPASLPVCLSVCLPTQLSYYDTKKHPSSLKMSKFWSFNKILKIMFSHNRRTRTSPTLPRIRWILWF